LGAASQQTCAAACSEASSSTRLSVAAAASCQPQMQSSRGDTHALSSFCDERHESSYLAGPEFRNDRPSALVISAPHLKKASPTASEAGIHCTLVAGGPGLLYVAAGCYFVANILAGQWQQVSRSVCVPCTEPKVSNPSSNMRVGFKKMKNYEPLLRGGS
jgi:hypothetical protein